MVEARYPGGGATAAGMGHVVVMDDSPLPDEPQLLRYYLVRLDKSQRELRVHEQEMRPV